MTSFFQAQPSSSLLLNRLMPSWQEAETTLTQLGSIQEVMCGLMLCIKNSNPPASPNPRVAFPVQQGHGIFIPAENIYTLC